MADKKTGETSMTDLQTEYGLEGNSAAEPTQDYGGEGAPAAEAKPAAKGEPEVAGLSEVEARVVRLQEDEGLADNVALLDDADARDAKEAEARGEKAEEAEAAEEAEETEEETDEGESGEADEEGEEEAEAEAAEEGVEGESADDATAEAEGEGPSEWTTWLTAEIPDADDRQSLLNAILESDGDPSITYKAAGQNLTEPLSEIVQKAAGYMGQGEVSRRLEAAADETKAAAVLKTEAETLKAEVIAGRDEITAQIDDPVAFTEYLTGNADLDYLTQLRDNISSAVDRIEEDPVGHQREIALSKRFNRIEGMLEKLTNGAGETTEPAAAADSDASSTDSPPSGFGFVPGQGYPETTRKVVLSAVEGMLEGSGITPRQALDAWNAEGRQRQILAVTRGLITRKPEKLRKEKLAKDPPVKKGPKRGRPRRAREAGVPESVKSSTKSWESIEGDVVKELEGAQQARELG